MRWSEWGEKWCEERTERGAEEDKEEMARGGGAGRPYRPPGAGPREMRSSTFERGGGYLLLFRGRSIWPETRGEAQPFWITRDC